MHIQLLVALLEFLRGRSGKWDAVKDAFHSEDSAVRILSVVLALAPAVLVALACLLACLFAVVR